MIKIHSSMSSIDIHNIKNALESNGIQCEVLGEFRRSVMGEIPLSEAFVELWILDHTKEKAAREIMAGGLRPASMPWTCPKCGEAIEAEFDLCWNCQSERPVESSGR